MKKFIIVLIASIISCISIIAKDRKITVDTEQHGVHVVEVLGTKIGGITETKPLFIGLQRWIADNDTMYVVITNVCTLSDLGVLDDAVMLIKTGNNEIIELESVMAESNNYTYRYGSPTVTVTRFKNMVTATYNDNSTNIVRNINYWKISEENINKLKDGIIKIRIMFKQDTYEKTFKKDKIGNILYDSYQALVNYNIDNMKNNFKQNF